MTYIEELELFVKYNKKLKAMEGRIAFTLFEIMKDIKSIKFEMRKNK